jgi:hypothetical protein
MAKKKDTYPVHLKGEIVEEPSRALWLIKWLFIIPHVIILCFLTVAFVIVTIIAFFSVLFTGRYPQGLFDFNVGVLRWWWRVSFYAYGALGTDVYPPFTLKSVDYPADLQIDHPEKMKHWLVLVKWFFAIPHYAVLAALTGFASRSVKDCNVSFIGLLGVLIVIVAFVLLFTRKYHRDIFKLIMGIQRWVYRVIAYVGLMTDEYPHFRMWE